MHGMKNVSSMGFYGSSQICKRHVIIIIIYFPPCGYIVTWDSSVIIYIIIICLSIMFKVIFYLDVTEYNIYNIQ